MTKYSFILLSGEETGFLEKLQEVGLVDITRSTKPSDSRSAALLAQIEDVKAKIATIQNGSDQTLTSLRDELSVLSEEARKAEPWGDFDESLLGDLTRSVGLHFYSVSPKQFNPEWEKEYAISVVNDGGKAVNFVVVGSNAGFPLKEIDAPLHSFSTCQSLVKAKEDEISEYKKALEAQREDIPALQEKIAQLSDEFNLSMAEAAGASAAENHLVTFEGFAPKDNEEQICSAIDATDVFYVKEDAVVEDEPPIEFKNNKFVKMFEVLTDMYGRPAYNGFDPTPFISVFFLLFFAFCMGDAGYGLVLVLGGIAMGKMNGMKSLAPLVTTLGVGTTVLGFIFHTFFSIDISTWKVFEPIQWIFLPSKIDLGGSLGAQDGTMVLAIIVGVIHLCIAMITKTVNETKNKGFLDSLSTWGWTLLIVGSVAIGSLAIIGVLDSAVTKWCIIVIGVLSAAGIFLLNNLHRNPLINIGSGLWETYNTATGLLGDVLSYLRLYALGLAGSMLGLAFNKIGTMVLGDGNSIILWIPFILIVVIGHTLNVAMCVLGAFVHPLRLNFLEFFKNSGYEAAGRKYSPLKKESKNQ